VGVLRPLGLRARDDNVYWTPIVVTKREIDAETERLASLPRLRTGGASR